ncbi:TerD family protein [Nakamurella sp. A5-74]|uniref:TerD family protein n=1 Tax=Nakamurella sp. A5-74 TaxID=3158264 RepID=A0AAU8DKX4_9ACTN
MPSAGELPVHLSKGANLALRSLDEELGSVTVILETEGSEGTAVDADVSVLLLGDDGRVRSNDDLIFYNQPVGADGAVHLRDKIRTDHQSTPVASDVVTVELDDLPDDVARIVLSASLDPTLGITFAAASSVTLRIARSSDAQELVIFGLEALSSETAMLFGEFYRRAGEWKIRAIGQGFADGLTALVTEFGVDVDNSEPALGEDLSADDSTSDASAEANTSNPSSPVMTEEALPVEITPVPAGTTRDDTAPEPARTAKVSVRRSTRAPKLPTDWDRTIPADTDADWQRARLFPVAGIGGAEEQERRATSALLAVLGIVREFGRAVTARVGAPAGAVTTFIEVPFGLDEQAYRPDGVITVKRGQREWRALVEVKTSDGKLNFEQVDHYVEIARAKNFDAVITISNQLAGSNDEHPIAFDRRKLKKVSLHHLSWEQIRTDAILLSRHARAADNTQAVVLDEFLRYMEHPRSGLHGFTDMGPEWVKIRDAVKHRTLRASDKGCAEVIAHFDQLVRHIGLQLTSLLGVETSIQPPRARADGTTRPQQLADSGQLFGSIRVPGAVDALVITNDLRSERVGVSIQVDAPRDGRPLTRINWLLRQIPDARDALRVEALLAGGRGLSTAELLGSVRKKPELLVPADGRDIRAFRLTLELPMGTKRNSGTGGVIRSVHQATTHLYAEVVQHLRPWNAKPPQLTAPTPD